MKILVLPGDGIGPKIVAAAVQVLQAADTAFGLGLSFDHDDAGFASLKKYGTTLRDELIDKAKTYDGIILGTQSHADYPPPEQGGRNISAGLRIGPVRQRPAGTHTSFPRIEPAAGQDDGPGSSTHANCWAFQRSTSSASLPSMSRIAKVRRTRRDRVPPTVSTTLVCRTR